jgi:type VI secretion system protein ImpI
LSPHRTGAVAGHAEVRYLDGGFCLIDRSGRTYINSSSQPVGRGRRARLNHGDTLTIGRYRMRAELNGEAAVNSGMEEDAGQHRQLVDVAEGSLLRSESGQALPDGREPLEGLHTPAGEPISEDPLAPWPETQERQGMSESKEQSREAKDTSRQHISGAPLMRGMEAEIDFADSDEMRLFLEEAGQTLKATVEGLLALHQGEDSRHRALRTRLQPIEDNPLRLGDDYAGTMQTRKPGEPEPSPAGYPGSHSGSAGSDPLRLLTGGPVAPVPRLPPWPARQRRRMPLGLEHVPTLLPGTQIQSSAGFRAPLPGGVRPGL